MELNEKQTKKRKDIQNCAIAALLLVGGISLAGLITRVIDYTAKQSKLEAQLRCEQEASHKLLRSVHSRDILIYTPFEYNLLTDLDSDGSPDVLMIERMYVTSYTPSYGAKPEPKYFIKKGAKISQSPGEDAVFVEPEFFEKYTGLMK